MTTLFLAAVAPHPTSVRDPHRRQDDARAALGERAADLHIALDLVAVGLRLVAPVDEDPRAGLDDTLLGRAVERLALPLVDRAARLPQDAVEVAVDIADRLRPIRRIAAEVIGVGVGP